MAFTRFATSEPWTRASGARINQLGDELEQQISILSADRGYRSGKVITDANTAIVNGKYLISSTGLNIPSNGSFAIDVSAEGGAGTQYAKCYYGANKGKFYTRDFIGTTFDTWKEIATAQAIKCTMLNGWTGDVYARKTGALVSFYGRISGGATSQGTQILETPFSFNIEYAPIFQTVSSQRGWIYSFANGIYIHSLESNTDLCLSVTIGG